MLIEAAVRPERLPADIREMLEDNRNELIASVASIWEVAIKRRKHGDRFVVTARELYQGCKDMDVAFLDVGPDATVAVEAVPSGHGDPFDLLILCQSQLSGATLLTTDKPLAEMSSNARWIRTKP